jgi:hypothetical protein
MTGTLFKYYLLDNGAGQRHEIYRGDVVPHQQFARASLWRAKKDGSWSSSDEDTTLVCNLIANGDFDPQGDEITQEQAAQYLSEWRGSGRWPGRD